MKEICPEFDERKTEFTAENRETYLKGILSLKRLKVSKKKKFTGMIETDGVSICVHDRRLKVDRPVLPSASPVTKHEGEKEADPAMQELEDNDLGVDVAKHEEKEEAGPVTQEIEHNDLVVDVTKDEEKKEAGPVTQEIENNDLVVGAAIHEDEKEANPTTQKAHENDFVVGADPGSTNTITIAAPKLAEDGIDGNLRQKYMRLLRLSRARYYRQSGIMNARKKIVTWNVGMKEHLEALSEVTSRGADFRAFR